MSATLHHRLAARLGLLAALLVAGCATPPAPQVAVKPLPPERQIPAGAAKALAEWFPELHVVSSSSGELQQSGVNGLAVVLARGDVDPQYVLALLEPGGTDDWRVMTASQAIAPGCAQCSVSADVAEHGVFVHVIRAVGPDFENFTYRFGWPAGATAPTLTGVTAYIPSQADDPFPHSFSAAVDMETGKRTDIIEDVQDDAPVHRERQSSVPVRPPIAFAEFSFAADALDAETRKLPPAPFDATGTLPPAAVAVLRERFPQMTLQSQASGTLDGDGLRDIVVVLAPADRVARAGAATDTVVAVLLGQPDGGLKLAGVSGVMAHDCPTCNVEVQIARRQLTVQTTAVDAGGSRTVDWQFAFRPKDAPLRLVAVRAETTQRTVDGDGRRTLATTNLMNGERVDLTDDLVHGHRSRSEQKSRLPVRDPIPLAAFGFDPARLGDEATAVSASPAASAPTRVSGS
jgi:hypothetical protein